ncbi:hypothetical protein FBUS_04213 [Fasciolopsis buskii]|uniref:Uncharacterized protein n=1 Tax=Fasciolopsis buskii TaxID=27845 RepID=A0A8E0RW35_9TREM|nr:hypothetical protein FBUS_04213 [Fasciolopsis buski]
MHQTNSNYEQVGLALSIRSVGLLSGSVIGGVASDKWKQQRAFIISASLFTAALTNAIIPWIRTLAGLATVLYMAGLSHGFHTTTLDATEDSDHFTALLTNTTEPALIRPAIPYNLVAGILLVSALCFIFFGGVPNRCSMCQSAGGSNHSTAKRSNMDADPYNQIQVTESCAQRFFLFLRATFHNISRYEVFLILGTFIIYFAVVGNERVFGKFMFTYALYGPIKMSTRLGYLLHLVYWIGFGLARIFTCFLAVIIPARVMLGALAVGTLLVSAGLILIPSASAWFFAFTCLFSLFKSPLFPSTLAAINLSHEITGVLVLVVNLGSAAGASLLQYTAGTLIQQHGQFVFPYLVCGSACVVLVTASGLIFVLRLMGDRFDRNSALRPDQIDSLIPSESHDIHVLQRKFSSRDNLSATA